MPCLMNSPRAAAELSTASLTVVARVIRVIMVLAPPFRCDDRAGRNPPRPRSLTVHTPRRAPSLRRRKRPSTLQERPRRGHEAIITSTAPTAIREIQAKRQSRRPLPPAPAALSAAGRAGPSRGTSDSSAPPPNEVSPYRRP